MKKTSLIVFPFLLTLFLGSCGQKEDPTALYLEADSLMTLVLDLQNRLGSSEIQRLYDFENEINQDILALDEVIEEKPALTQYLDLRNGLGQCMQACNQFHEEAFFLESTLRDLMTDITNEESNPEKIREQLDFELNIYTDLSFRVDSSMEVAINQARIFYELKPEIENLKEQFNDPPEAEE